MQDWIERCIRPEIRALTAYQVADASGLIKLDAMENPYTLPPEVHAAWQSQLGALDFNRYPDPGAQGLKLALRAALGLPADIDVLLGNGSDEIIQLLALACAKPDAVLLSVEPGFAMYSIIASWTQMRYIGVPLLGDDFRLDRQSLLQAIATHQPALMFLAYPNNPTGNLFDRQVIIDLIQTTPGLVVIDEAYAPFTDASFLEELGRFPNLLVMRTLSKMGLAGLRVGYLAGPRAWLQELDKVRLPYNINTLSQATATFALQRQAVFTEQARRIRFERSRLVDALNLLPGVRVYPSEANFVLMRAAEHQGPEIFAGLKKRGILIKNLDRAHPLLKDCLRLTIGSESENRQLLEALRDLIAPVNA